MWRDNRWGGLEMGLNWDGGWIGDVEGGLEMCDELVMGVGCTGDGG